jgi:ABC-type multidrug transport system ATPase subunit
VTNAESAIEESPRTRSHDAAEALVLEKIVQRWPAAKHPVLGGVDLALHAGSVSRLTGRNGAGKTTLLRIAAGLIEADSGRLSAFGLDPFRDRRRYQRLTAYVPTGSVGLYARLSPRQHLEFEARLALLPPPRRRSAIDRELRRFELVDVASRRVDRLSMGQRQRVRLAIALVRGAQVLLLDEPLNSLDADGVALLRTAIESIAARGGAVMWCSPHEDHLGLELDQALVLEQGKVWVT